jgi:hypothetical protein
VTLLGVHNPIALLSGEEVLRVYIGVLCPPSFIKEFESNNSMNLLLLLYTCFATLLTVCKPQHSCCRESAARIRDFDSSNRSVLLSKLLYGLLTICSGTYLKSPDDRTLELVGTGDLPMWDVRAGGNGKALGQVCRCCGLIPSYRRDAAGLDWRSF